MSKEMTSENLSDDIYEFPVSPTQGALWVLNQMMPDNPSYNIPMVVRIEGSVNGTAVKQAIEELVVRHEILRTHYAEVGGQLMQHVHKSGTVNFQEKSFIDEGEDALNDFLLGEVQGYFNLPGGEVIRAGLLQESDSCFIFYMVVHHIAVDHSAILKLSEEFSALYSVYSQGNTPNLVESELQYADYVIWSKENAGDLNQSIAAWKRNFDGFSGVLSLPNDKPRPPFPSGNGAELRFSFSEKSSSLIKGFSRANNSSLYQMLLSAFNVLLARYSGQKDIIVGTPFSNRQEGEGLEEVVGCFINTLPLATQIGEEMTFSECIAAVKKTLLFAYENQHIPFETIVKECVEQRDLSYNPLFQVGFVFQEPPATIALNGLQCSMVDIHTGGAMYDLHLWLWEKGDQLQGVVWYNTDIYQPSTIGRLIENYETLIGGLIATPEASVYSVHLTSKTDDEINQGINTTLKDIPTTPLPSLVSDQALKTPEAIAARFSNGIGLSYKTLDMQSNYLAKLLVDSGVA
ncbi:MAG: hypothetical protein ACJAYG_000301, partial [Oceanicoccus sp.]